MNPYGPPPPGYPNYPPPPGPHGHPPPPYGHPPPGYPQGRQIQFYVTAWGLFKNFPQNVSIDETQFVDTLVRQVCQAAQISYQAVRGLKIKPAFSRNQSAKAQILPPNWTIGQVANTHQKGNEAIQVHLDLMPQIGTQIIPSPQVAGFDYGSLDNLKQNSRPFGETVCAMINGNGGTCLIGVGIDLRIKGIYVPNTKKEIQQTIVEILKDHIYPPQFNILIKAKVHPLIDVNGAQTNLQGIVVQIEKCPRQDIAFTYDYVYFYREGDQNKRAYPHEVINLLRQKKGKQQKQFILTFGF